MAGEEGIEPTLTVLETAVLPLNHSPMESQRVEKDYNANPKKGKEQTKEKRRQRRLL